jgi:hypothetical protein
MLASTVPVLVAHSSNLIAVPRLSVEPSCRAASSLKLADGQSFADCMRDEAEARKDVARNWTSYSSAARARCSTEVLIGGDPS